jgi:hypothetical protein
MVSPSTHSSAEFNAVANLNLISVRCLYEYEDASSMSINIKITSSVEECSLERTVQIKKNIESGRRAN